MDDGLTALEVKQLRRLLKVEQIREQKNRYSHLMDSLDFEGFAQLYTDDAVGDWGPYGVCHGRTEILDRIKQFMGGNSAYTVLHSTTNLWIELTGPDTALSRSYLHDVFTKPRPHISPTAWFAIYEEDWVEQDGTWRISRHRVQFLWPKRDVDDAFPRAMVHVRAESDAASRAVSDRGQTQG